MGVVGKYHIQGPSGVISVDIVDLGDSQTGHSLRIRTPKGIKEFNLVTRDDDRSSSLSINTPWGVLSPAEDGRNVIAYPDDVASSRLTLYYADSDPDDDWMKGSHVFTDSVLLGVTSFNKVVRVEANVDLYARLRTERNASGGVNTLHSTAKLRIVGAQVYQSGEAVIDLEASNLNIFGHDKEQTISALLVVNVPNGAYEVWLDVAMETFIPSSGTEEATFWTQAWCREWRERTKV